MKNNFKILFICVLTSLMASCNLCNYHMKKARQKCGYTSDTIRVIDTVTINSSSVDTLFRFNHSSDTIVLKENGVIVKYFYNTKDSTVYLKGEREIIKVPYEKKIIVNKYNRNLPWWVAPLKWFFLLLILIVGVVIGYNYLSKKFRITKV